MRSTLCFLATFTAYVGSCRADRPEFGQPVNNSVADAANGREDADAGTPSGTDLSSSARRAGVDGSNTTTSASDASSRDEGGASTAETSSSKSTGVDTGGDAPQTTTTDDNGANGDGADGGADGGASAG